MDCSGHLTAAKLREMAPADSPQEGAPRKRSGLFGKIARIAAVGLLFFGSAWLVQRLVFNRALASALEAAKQLSESLPGPRTDESRHHGYFFPLFPFSPEQLAESSQVGSSAADTGTVEPGNEAGRTPPGASTTLRSSPPASNSVKPTADLDGPPAKGPMPQNVRADRARVLGWANGQLAPQGRTAAASFGMPAGIELFQVGALGVGLRDRDRLVAVDGVPVTSRADVVVAALGARGRQQEVIVATLVRNTESGPVLFQVAIEQPYLSEEEIEELTQPKASN